MQHLLPGLGRSPGEENGNPLQYSCLANIVDKGAWWAIVHGVAKESDVTQWLNNKLPLSRFRHKENTGKIKVWNFPLLLKYSPLTISHITTEWYYEYFHITEYKDQSFPPIALILKEFWYLRGMTESIPHGYGGTIVCSLNSKPQLK